MPPNCITGVLLVFSIIGVSWEVGAADPLRSGPVAGETLPGMFHTLALANKDSETQECFICRYGKKPVVLIFAREFNDPVFDLIKQLDSAAAANRDSPIGVFVVFYGHAALKQRDELRRQGEKQKLTETVLSIYPAEMPRGYYLPSEAAVTVLICRNLTVRTNVAFRSGELRESDMKAILKAAKQVTE